MVRTWLASAFLVFVSTVPVFAAADGPPAAGDPGVPAALTAASPTAQRPALLSLYVSFAALNVYDGFSTISALKRGATEANPVMGGVAGNPVALLAVKAGVTAGSIFLAERLWKQHHRTKAVAMMIAANGIMMAVAANNASVLRGMK